MRSVFCCISQGLHSALIGCGPASSLPRISSFCRYTIFCLLIWQHQAETTAGFAPPRAGWLFGGGIAQHTPSEASHHKAWLLLTVIGSTNFVPIRARSRYTEDGLVKRERVLPATRDLFVSISSEIESKEQLR